MAGDLLLQTGPKRQTGEGAIQNNPAAELLLAEGEESAELCITRVERLIVPVGISLCALQRASNLNVIVWNKMVSVRNKMQR